MDQTDCTSCPPYGCTCHYTSTNPKFSQQGRFLSTRVPLQGNPCRKMLLHGYSQNQMLFQGSPPAPFPLPRPQSRRSFDFQGDPNLNQGNPQHQSNFPTARVGHVRAFVTPQVNF